jgi:hypothetical protein
MSSQNGFGLTLCNRGRGSRLLMQTNPAANQVGVDLVCQRDGGHGYAGLQAGSDNI